MEELRELRKIDLELKKKLKMDTKIFFKMFKDKKKSDFKNRYHENLEFKEKHKKYMLEKTNCKKCGQMVARNYMSVHHKTKKCLNKSLEIKKLEKAAENRPCDLSLNSRCPSGVLATLRESVPRHSRSHAMTRENIYKLQNEILKKVNKLPFVLKKYLLKS